jgi:hypothetical protein
VVVEPSDPKLVRMVVVFEDGIPVGVDATSPYSIPGVGTGNLEVRVYPRYASSTLYVTAVPTDDDVPSPPLNLRIVDN